MKTGKYYSIKKHHFPSGTGLPFTYPLFSFKKGQASQKYQTNMAYQVALKLVTSPNIVCTRQPSRYKSVPKADKNIRNMPCSLCYEHHKIPGTKLYYIYKGLSLDTFKLLDFQFSLSEAQWVQVCWFCGFCCSVIDPSGSLNPSSASSTGFYLMFGCVSFSASVSISCYINTLWLWIASLLYKSTSEYHYKSIQFLLVIFIFFLSIFARDIFFYSRYLGNPASGFGSSWKCQGSALSHGMFSSWTSQWPATTSFCATIIPAHLTGRIDCKLKILWLSLCPNIIITKSLHSRN